MVLIGYSENSVLSVVKRERNCESQKCRRVKNGI